MSWEAVRASYLAAFEEASTAVRSCESEEDLKYVLDIVEGYAPLGRRELSHALRAGVRVDEMRAAVERMHRALQGK